jgi:hypothetical protein
VLLDTLFGAQLNLGNAGSVMGSSVDPMTGLVNQFEILFDRNLRLCALIGDRLLMLLIASVPTILND